ncbi:hypothetical protein G9G63_17095 [Paenibacillus sp. EKM202P]|nr:hypothetical protein G9G63_17095 [Paenibacillus sp. EKM202P]KAF6567923.1 hypothetical protein G9G64_16850 [Paenibacillus sp. EKM207P]
MTSASCAAKLRLMFLVALPKAMVQRTSLILYFLWIRALFVAFDRQQKRFEFKVEAVALDSGYLTTSICKGLQSWKTFAVIAHRRFHPKQGLFPKWKFTFDAERSMFVCPANHELKY